MRCQLRQVEPGRRPQLRADGAGESWPVDRPGITRLSVAGRAQRAGLIGSGQLQ